MIRTRLLIAVVGLVVLALLGAWLARVPIATGVIDRTLAAKGVPARYRVADLGFGRQRLTDVVIGDPADPDLVADWIETRTDIGPAGARVTGIRAGHVRLRGRVVDGKLRLGAIDRLLPAPSGAPFALPAIDLALADGRMRLETPIGVFGLRLAGSGGLADGFRGTMAVVATPLAVRDCTITGVEGVLALRIDEAAPRLAGPIRAGRAACPGATVRAPEGRIDVALSPALDRWRGGAAVRTARITASSVAAAGVSGQIDFAGTAARTEGSAQLRLIDVGARVARSETLAFAGRWRIAPERAIVAGRFDAGGASLDRSVGAAAARAGASAAGTPLAPIAANLGRAATRAAARFDIGGELALGNASGRYLVTIGQIAARSASGAVAGFGNGAGIVIGDPAGLRADGRLTIAGGGFPNAQVLVSQPLAGGTVRGVATIAAMTAGSADVRVTPIRFAVAPAGTVELRTQVTLSGPLGDGRVERLEVPVALRRRAGGAIVINDRCVPLRFQRLTLAGLTLGATAVPLCPVDGAMAQVNDGRIGGGVRSAALRLAGRLGSSPLTLTAGGVTWRHAEQGFIASSVAARLGAADQPTVLDLATLSGTVAGGGVTGRFAGGAGRIGAVPLLLSDAAGGWRLTGGVLSLDGAMSVADADGNPRFRPLAASDVSLRLVDGKITATGRLIQPTKGVRVADVAIRHRLSSGTGAARLTVPGLTFGDGFQPEELTRLTFGVIADVKGTVSGVGDIAWSPAGVTSTGTFRTDGTDLAAAFGPVTGIRGEIRFTDLLGLESAPRQVATVASINPGVAVTDGRIEYQLLRGLRVAVAGGRWPFAGGTLTLEPTLLDFASPQARRMTFRVAGMDARQFLQQFDFKNLDATGVFDGELPMVFDQNGGRIVNGTLVVREGGGALAYLGELSEKNLGTWGNIAFQALRSLRYRNLQIVMNGALAGEMVTEVRFAGVSQGEGAKSNFLIRRLQKLPFVFNVRIAAPFRGLIDSAASFYDPKRLIERNLPALLDEQEKRAAPPTIQPPASETMR
ncbi:hypothetical protein F1C10_00900 [Sphingomonas sp. NBWT7]|nr:hypothetical protein F1C10_00900 [Sphingomonas sp. NBWT7]